MSLKITVYSKSACQQCDTAKMLLKSRSLPFEEIRIDDEAERLAFYEKCGPSVRQMPRRSSSMTSAWVALRACRWRWRS